MKIHQAAVAVCLIICTEAIGQTTSLWANATPGTQAVTNDNASVTLGLKFYSDMPGSVTGVRFYKGPYNTGPHVGTLWSSAGKKLASVTFSGESAAGWQQANFSSPVSIAAQSVYVISYFAPQGHYACDQSYPWSTAGSSPLHAYGASAGVFAYGSTTQFPSGTWNRSNYWVDVAFVPQAAPPPANTYSISGTVSGSAAANLTLSGTVSGSATTDALGKYSFSNLPNGLYVVAVSKSGYTFTPPTASVSVSTTSVTGINFTGTAIPTPLPHTVALNWNASTSETVIGYNLYRADVAGGQYSKLNAARLTTTEYVDSGVSSGRVYYYVTTAVDNNDVESAYSNQATAVVPNP
ncbi:MAG TPA: DUF4082 domain-containing protein [Anaerolineales bacterium]